MMKRLIWMRCMHKMMGGYTPACVIASCAQHSMAYAICPTPSMLRGVLCESGSEAKECNAHEHDSAQPERCYRIGT